ncbi:MAG: DJ-1/PfpI family protein [Pirellulaceae bacterium]|nr:DJ-1/PfpI family protein [Planctomycetales bacterium]
MAHKIFFPIGDGTEIMDTMYAIFRLKEEGFQVDICGPEARLYNGVMHEIPPNPNVPWDITREQAGYHIKASMAFRDVNPEEYFAAFFSGGRAPEYIRYDEHLLAATRHFFDTNKPIGMLCHGVEIPAAAGCLKGRTATTVPKCALDITMVGGTYVNQDVVVDGNLVSAIGWQQNAELMREFCRLLRSRM